MGWQDRAYNQENNGGIPPVVYKMPPFTRLTAAIIVACLLILLAQAFRVGGGSIYEWGMLSYQDGLAFRQPWRFITYQYLHAGASHFFFNMLGLYFFLPTLELTWGWKKALGFYTLGGIAAGLAYGVISLVMPGGFLLGASGSVLAALGAVALLYPNRQFIFGISIRMGAALIGLLYFLSTLIDRNPADAAHLGGLIFGFYAPLVAGPTLSKYRRNWQRRQIHRIAKIESDEQETIDRILAKVSAHGMQSLTNGEKKALKRATERQQRAEMSRGRR